MNFIKAHDTRNYLITGAAGFIGSAFVRKVLRDAHNVVGLDALTYAGHVQNLEPEDFRNLSGKFKLVVGNICNGSLVSELLNKNRICTLVNFAAESHVDRSITTPSNFIQTNIQGTFTLLNVALEFFNLLPEENKRKFRYVQISTDEVFGSLGADGKFSEITSFAPNSPYSASKASADHLVRAWHHTYGLPTITTHCSNNYGPRQYPEKLIPHMIACALMGKPLPVYGDGGNIRDWIHVEDHCDGIQLAIENGKSGSTYCFGGNSENNNLELVRTICRILDELRPRENGKSYESSIIFVADRLGHDRRYAIDDRFAERELGFKRRFKFEDGLRETVLWYLNNESWSKAVTSMQEVKT